MLDMSAVAQSNQRQLDAFETAVRAGLQLCISESGLGKTTQPWLSHWTDDLTAELRKIGAEVLTADELAEELRDAIGMGMAEDGFPSVQDVTYWLSAAVVEKCAALNVGRFTARSV